MNKIIVFVKAKKIDGNLFFDAGEYWTDDIRRAKIYTVEDSLVGCYRAKALEITKDWVVPIELIDNKPYLRLIAEESLGGEKELERFVKEVNSLDFSRIE